MFTIIFITINEKKINLKPKSLEIFDLLLLLPLSNWYLPAKTEKEVSIRIFKQKQINKSSLKLVGRNQIVFGFIMFYLSSLQITRRFLFLVHKEESKNNLQAYN